MILNINKTDSDYNPGVGGTLGVGGTPGAGGTPGVGGTGGATGAKSP